MAFLRVLASLLRHVDKMTHPPSPHGKEDEVCHVDEIARPTPPADAGSSGISSAISSAIIAEEDAAAAAEIAAEEARARTVPTDRYHHHHHHHRHHHHHH